MAVGKKAGSRRAPSVFARFRGFLREARAELRKVTWPGRRQLVAYTIVVLVTTVIVGLFIGAFDMIFSRLITFLATQG